MFFNKKLKKRIEVLEAIVEVQKETMEDMAGEIGRLENVVDQKDDELDELFEKYDNERHKGHIEEYMGYKVGDRVLIHDGDERTISYKKGLGYFFTDKHGSQTSLEREDLKDLILCFQDTIRKKELN